MKELLIVGVDPGTTTAYSILDLKGNLIEVKSQKNFGLNALIENVTRKGTVLLVGTDRKSIPKFIEDFATKTGARTVRPDHDLFEGEKARLTKNFKYKNEHEKDAIASAIIALKGYRPLIRKIDKYIEDNNKQEVREKLMKTVILNNINIKEAVSIIEQPEKEVKEERVIERKEYTIADYLKLKKIFHKLKKENRFLKKQKKRFIAELEEREAKEKYFAKQINKLVSEERANDRKEKKEQTIEALQQQLIVKEGQLKAMEEELRNLNSLLAETQEKAVAKKLKNLGWEEYSSKKELLKIKQEELLLVEDPNIYSEKTRKELKEATVIIHKMPLNQKTRKELNFIFIDGKKLKIKEDKHFALIDAKELEQEKNKIGIIEKVVEGYRKERK